MSNSQNVFPRLLAATKKKQMGRNFTYSQVPNNEYTHLTIAIVKQGYCFIRYNIKTFYCCTIAQWLANRNLNGPCFKTVEKCFIKMLHQKFFYHIAQC